MMQQSILRVYFITGILLLFIKLNAQVSDKQPSAFGINFLLYDFESAANVRAGTLSQAIRDNRFARIEKMTPGLALTYFKGLSSRYNFSTTLAGAFISYPIPDRPFRRTESFLLEGNVSVQGKMLPMGYWVNPYVQIGIGASTYSGYWGAFIPAGLGIQITFFKEAYLLINSQYRIPVTPTSEYHFYYSLGIAGKIGN